MPGEKAARISVHVSPGSPRNQVTASSNGTFRLKITAPPVKGKANQEMVSFLSERLNIEKRRINIISGQTSRNKVVSIQGLAQEEVIRRLSADLHGD